MGVAGSTSAGATTSVRERFRAPESRSTPCLNCGASLAGPFCSTCGQRDVPPYPSVRDLVVDAFWELSGWDGRFMSTVRELFRHPGKLTREFLEGRRARYLSPLRLYLMASLVYFLVAAVAPNPTSTSPLTVNVGGVRVSGTTSTPERVAAAATAAATSQQAPTGAKYEQALRDIAKAPAVFRPFLRRLMVDPAGFKRGLVETMPRALFALVPVFAAIVALFYRGRKYPEHLYFAIHFHSFVFLALLVPLLARFTRVPMIASVLGFAVLIWILTYASMSFRRLYGGSMAGTIAKEIGIGVLYLFASFIALLVTIYWVALWG